MEAGLQAPDPIVLLVDQNDSSTGWQPCVSMSYRGILALVGWNGLSGAFRLEFFDIKLQQKYCTYLLKIRSVSFQDKKIMRTSFTYISLFIEVGASNMIQVIKEKLK